ncbi:hypothetical protein FMEXI_12925 [Fusarium mexicanum]|uniref:NB-ARC domain-containing protein n=1 Tax=Fusarium mexicanum TaxID=751941 RepID=A0A8H5MK15_9HYPO|nr:hypothetical protein FMEXI_12925 [Fusarium mexicanum]
MAQCLPSKEEGAAKSMQNAWTPSAVRREIAVNTIFQGLGGVGKTQIALEAAYRLRDTDPFRSVFWVPAMDAMTFENA